MTDMEIPGRPRYVSLGRQALNWARDSVRSRGAWGTLRNLAEQLGLLVRDSFPDRRRSRFGDIDYDCDFGVDTTWARLPWSVRVREIFTERLYQPTDPAEFRSVIAHIPAEFSELAFIDLGSGKGRALLLASEYPFREIVGVEVQPELHRIAQENILRFGGEGRVCRRISSVCMDAREFEFPEEPLLLYLFNPFPDYVLTEVLRRLEASLAASPRPAFLLYNTPMEQHIFERMRFLEKIYEEHNFQVYRSRPV